MSGGLQAECLLLAHSENSLRRNMRSAIRRYSGQPKTGARQLAVTPVTGLGKSVALIEQAVGWSAQPFGGMVAANLSAIARDEAGPYRTGMGPTRDKSANSTPPEVGADAGTGIRHQQIRAGFPTISTASSRQLPEPVKPCDHGLEHKADACFVPGPARGASSSAEQIGPALFEACRRNAGGDPVKQPSAPFGAAIAPDAQPQTQSEGLLGTFDLIVVGGGVNGVGIARDAAGRGLTVLLCEKDDLAQGTSSRSGKLVHGGLRYLEYYEFRLVREALIEREVLLNAAPHIIWPMRFVLPHSPEQRPAWMIRFGLFLYDHLGGRKKLPRDARASTSRRARRARRSARNFSSAFEYSDCWVDDARLVVLNALDLQKRGGDVRLRTALVAARRDADGWSVSSTTPRRAERERARQGARQRRGALGRGCVARRGRRRRQSRAPRQGQPHRHPQVLGGRAGLFPAESPMSASSSSIPTKATFASSARPTFHSTAGPRTSDRAGRGRLSARRRQSLFRHAN